MTQEPIVVKSVEINVSTNHVWRALTEPDQITRWMGGARVESTWEIGSDITLTGKLPNFSHWSEMLRLPDTPQNRTIITLILERIEEKTRFTVRHENFRSEAEYKHANFFWGIALNNMKNLLEQ